jgi:hypothetical protein
MRSWWWVVMIDASLYLMLLHLMGIHPLFWVGLVGYAPYAVTVVVLVHNTAGS